MSCTRRFVTAVPMMFALGLLANRHHCTLLPCPLRFAEAERVHCRWAMLGAAGVLAQVGMHLHVRISASPHGPRLTTLYGPCLTTGACRTRSVLVRVWLQDRGAIWHPWAGRRRVLGNALCELRKVLAVQLHLAGHQAAPL